MTYYRLLCCKAIMADPSIYCTHIIGWNLITRQYHHIPALYRSWSHYSAYSKSFHHCASIPWCSSTHTSVDVPTLLYVRSISAADKAGGDVRKRVRNVIYMFKRHRKTSINQINWGFKCRFGENFENHGFFCDSQFLIPYFITMSFSCNHLSLKLVSLFHKSTRNYP